ncbi:MAG: hypothetical protein RLZZ08_668 [Pseudomonadota bacterium]
MSLRAHLSALLFALAVATPAAAQDAGAHRRLVHALDQAEASALARFGPFRVLDAETAALADVTDSDSPAQFAAMLRAYPAIHRLQFHDCPGTYDDQANLQLGRMIRANGLAVEVPDGGSVRSGAVELVFAGASIAIADGAEFAVHSWEDDEGREASAYAADSPQHRIYLAYYRDMGLQQPQAAQFYALTNSVRFDHPLYLTGRQMRGWLPGNAANPAIAVQPAQTPSPQLAYLDLGPPLN